MSKRFEVDTNTFVRFWLVILAFILIGLFIWKAATGLILVGISIFLAVAIWPLAKRINKKISHDKNRQGLASVLAYLIVLAVISFAVAVVGPVVVNETGKFIAQVPNNFEVTFGSWVWIDDLGEQFGADNLREDVFGWLKETSASLITSAGSIVVNSVGVAASVITGAILVMVLTLLFLLEGPAIMKKFWSFLKERKQEETEKISVWKRIADEMANVIATYVSRQAVIAVLDGFVVTIVVLTLAILFGFSTNLALPMGLIAMVLYLIPMFGPIIACVLIALIIIFSNPVAGLLFAAIYAVYLQVESNVVAPKVQGDALSMPPLVILVAITIGIYMFGLVGAIVAIPVAGCIKVLIDEYPNLKKS